MVVASKFVNTIIINAEMILRNKITSGAKITLAIFILAILKLNNRKDR